MEKQVYMVTKGKKAVITYNKKRALIYGNVAKAKVYQLSYGYYKDCNFVMDMPTFCAVGNRIY